MNRPDAEHAAHDELRADKAHVQACGPREPVAPMQGVQELSTGVLGCFVFLLFFCAYALYRLDVGPQPNGGPLVTEVLPLVPASLRIRAIARDYYDLLTVALLAFGFMAIWDNFRARHERALALLTIAVGQSLAFLVARARPSGNAVLWEQSRRLWYVGGRCWTAMEVVYLVPTVGLLLLALYGLARRRTHWPKRKVPLPRAISSALQRWVSGLLLFLLVVVLALGHPFYRAGDEYLNWRFTICYFAVAYSLLGFPLALLTVLYRSSPSEDRRDALFVTMLLLRACWRALLRRQRSTLPTLSTIVRSEPTRVLLRDLLVKLFFGPLMIGFYFGQAAAFFRSFPSLLENVAAFVAFALAGPSPLARLVRAPEVWLALSNAFSRTALSALFLMDTGLGMIGYFASSRWLGNKSKSVEPTLFGWTVALACYPPFNSVTTSYFPYDRATGDKSYFERALAIFEPTSAAQLRNCITSLCNGVTLLLFSVYVYATAAFGLRFSNLTHRGVLARGPYAWVRHPAYISKNLAWWTENVLHFSSPWQFLSLLGLNAIYTLRAMTEERHLRADPSYVAYATQVRFRFIPGVW